MDISPILSVLEVKLSWNERTESVLGREKTALLATRSVLIVGAGGVGGYAVEQLARIGVGQLIVVDGDIVSDSNLNRQLIALRSTVGMAKVTAAEARCLDINPGMKFTAVPRFLRPEEMAAFLDEQPADYLVEAIDDVPAKVALLAEMHRRGLPGISAMGAGGKTDPSQVRYGDIAKSFGCPLARIVRKKLREQGINSGIYTVFSPETPCGIGNGTIGSVSFLPALFGCFCAAAAVSSLLGGFDAN